MTYRMTRIMFESIRESFDKIGKGGVIARYGTEQDVLNYVRQEFCRSANQLRLIG